MIEECENECSDEYGIGGGTIQSIESFEKWLMKRIANDDEDSNAQLIHCIVPDVSWLHCRRFRKSNNGRITVTGLLEVETPTVAPFERKSLHLTTWRVAAHKVDTDPTFDGECICRYPPNHHWKRQTLQYSPSSILEETHNKSVASVHWIDLTTIDASTVFATHAAVVHMLRSILGTGHDSSPWVENICATTTTTNTCGLFPRSQRKDCVVLFFAEEVPNILVQFRVSDVCPSWCLYSTANLICGGELLIYRRLPPRLCLSSHHPITNEIVPITGCLWETVVTYPEQQDQDTAIHDEPIVAYRVTAPPYFNFDMEYNHCQIKKFLEPQIQMILRKEVESIPLWTAWPEQEHYVATDNGQAPWNVFPVCHCFPANDNTKFTWIQATAEHIPRTVQFLQRFVGPYLRTALFSRLDPEAVLEAHTGWADLANHVLRVHVPVEIPPGHLCGTWVDGCVATHCNDQLLVFDDSKTHRAFNYSKQSRIVLIVDLERPTSLPMGTASGGHSEELDDFVAQFTKPK